MTNHYTLLIISPPDVVWSHVFDEVALGLESVFKELGYKVSTVTDPAAVEGIPIVFGANLCPMYHIDIPSDAIIFNLEQVHPDSRWFKPDYGYIDLLKKHSVWDFSQKNIETLVGFGVHDVVLCEIGYVKELTRIRRKKEDVDVMFVGGNHPRRKKIMDEIAASGVRFHQVYKIFGHERDGWIARGKIHLNMHKESAHLFEIARVSYLLANGCFVISENCEDTEMMERFKGGVVFCPYEELVERCLYYLVHPKKRKEIAQTGFEMFRNMPQAIYLKSAIKKQTQMDAKKAIRRNPAAAPVVPSIFVAIASFRDSEIQPTIKDLFQRAAHPERITVGVCLQIDPEEDASCTVDPAFRPSQVRVRQVHYSESKGANWARVQALELLQNEQYVLMIDSHMRFAPGWDKKMLEMLAQMPSKKPVLSGYVPDYRPPNLIAEHPGALLRIRLKHLKNPEEQRIVHVSGKLTPISEERAHTLYPTPFCVANFMFAPVSTFKEVPVDPHIHFWGDEIDFAARLWTHGYDIFQPNDVVLRHYWVRKEKFHLHDYRVFTSKENVRSLRRIRHRLGIESSQDSLALEDMERYGLGRERRLQDLWDFAGVDPGTKKITDNAAEGIWNMTARDKGRADNKPNQLPRIFVQIPAYRDPDCQNTVKDLFEKATHPERIFVGIAWQFVKEEDAICFQVPYPYPDQVRVQEIDARQGRGVCWARSLVQKLWQGEEFTLQIDSHMRFVPGWDEMFLSMWKDCGTDKAVLTCYPPGFTPPDQFENRFFFGMSAKEFDSSNIFLMIGAPAFEVGRNEPARPIPGAFASANCMFGPSSIIRDVPYDPHLYFFGEEIMMAVRLWTHGYELFHPNKLVIFHDWNRDKRPTHFSDFKNWGEWNDRSFKRVRHLLGTEKTADAEVLVDIEKYGLGKVRTLEEYQIYSGVNFAHRTITNAAKSGVFNPDYRAKQQQPKPMNFVSKADLFPEPTQARRDGKIYVNIASYRDPECQWTVKDLFEKATHPDRINVGICWQFDPLEDRHCFEIITRPNQVRIMPVNWREAEGVCWARFHTQQLWEGEEYTLMIDSHMRFVPGWDELMIQELQACESNKPILSCSPSRYTPPNNLDTRNLPSIRRVKPFMPDGNIRCQGDYLDRSPPKPLKAAFLVANFIFSRSEFTSEVPYDPFLYFDQEEITYAIRAYTHGWDIFSARTQFLYHYYNDKNAADGTVRPLHWRDLHRENEGMIRSLRDRGLKRFNHLTGFEYSNDPEITRQLNIYGFGRERSLAQYEQFSGIDFKRKIASEKALRCGFIENLHLYRDHPIYVPELDDKKNGASVVRAAEEAPFLRMLETGDYFPLVEIDDSNKKVRAIEAFGGKFCLAGYLPAGNPEFLALFFRELSMHTVANNLQDIHLIFILDDTPEKLEALRQQLQIAPILYADPGRAIARSFGVVRANENITPVGWVLNPNLKITHRHINTDPAKLALALVRDFLAESNKFNEKSRPRKVISESVPAVIVENALSPELCAKCIEAFKNGHTFDGTVGALEAKAYRADVKIRTDHIVENSLLAELDEKLSRSLFPELKKVFGLDVAGRERYKIGLYSGEKKGFFKQHRDNFDIPMGYRRIAVTIQLNDTYSGGGLRFPEYDDHIYQPKTGAAIAFSCSTLHEARPVTEGERIILVCFFHGPEEEAYRRHFSLTKGLTSTGQDFTPYLRQYPNVRLSRDFYKTWQRENVSYDAKNNVPPPAAPIALQSAAPMLSSGRTSGLINMPGNHQAKKVFESRQAIIFDDFLPEYIYQHVNNYALVTDYERINTHGKSVRAWHVHDGFPLRTCKNVFYNAAGHTTHSGENVYPSKSPFDPFIEQMLAIQPHVEHLIGRQSTGWGHFSVTGWMYPHGTGLAMHDDGSGVYTGAYVYFLNPVWRPHWGGLLLLADEEANQKIHAHRQTINQHDFYQRKWLHASPLDEILMETGFAQCILPKRNRMVFIANNAYHMVTRVNEQSGDNLRMSLAGFFNKAK